MVLQHNDVMLRIRASEYGLKGGDSEVEIFTGIYLRKCLDPTE